MERGLHADHAVHARVAERDPDGVPAHAERPRPGQPIASRAELGRRDVQPDEPLGLRDFGDERVLGAEPVPDVQDHPARRQPFGERRDQPANGERRLGLVGPVTLPQPEVQPAVVEREEEVRPQAVVDGAGQVRPAPKERRAVSGVRPRPPGRCHRSTVRGTRGGDGSAGELLLAFGEPSGQAGHDPKPDVRLLEQQLAERRAPDPNRVERGIRDHGRRPRAAGQER